MEIMCSMAGTVSSILRCLHRYGFQATHWSLLLTNTFWSPKKNRQEVLKISQSPGVVGLWVDQLSFPANTDSRNKIAPVIAALDDAERISCLWIGLRMEAFAAGQLPTPFHHSPLC